MATATLHYGFVKPEYSDAADIEDINGNMDEIDTALYNLDQKAGTVGTAVNISGNKYKLVLPPQEVNE